MTDSRGFFMSKRELLKLEVTEAFRNGKISRKQAASSLGVSERQISRYAGALRLKGVPGLVHGNRGRAPKNRTNVATKQAYLKLYQEVFGDFNFYHAWEMIHAHEMVPKQSQVCYQSFRKWCRQAGLGKIKRRRVSKARIMRERSANEGAILQMDGSPHRWFGQQETSLLVMIDDATSKVAAAHIAPSETTVDSIQLLETVVRTHGIPEVIITDQAGWSGQAGKRQEFTQFGRVCDELGIILVRTSTPESKGRVERFFRTAQDRLIPELKLYGIEGFTDSNRYLKQCFLESWNEQFSVEASQFTKRYRSVPKHLNLEEIFCLKYKRQINRDQTVSFRGHQYRILNRELGSLARREVMIHINHSGELQSLFLGQKRLSWEQVNKKLSNRFQKSA